MSNVSSRQTSFSQGIKDASSAVESNLSRILGHTDEELSAFYNAYDKMRESKHLSLDDFCGVLSPLGMEHLTFSTSSLQYTKAFIRIFMKDVKKILHQESLKRPVPASSQEVKYFPLYFLPSVSCDGGFYELFPSNVENAHSIYHLPSYLLV